MGNSNINHALFPRHGGHGIIEQVHHDPLDLLGVHPQFGHLRARVQQGETDIFMGLLKKGEGCRNNLVKII